MGRARRRATPGFTAGARSVAALLAALGVAAGCAGRANQHALVDAMAGGGSSGGDTSDAGGAPASAGETASGVGPYVPGPHGGVGQPCYPNATCNAGLDCQRDFTCSQSDAGSPPPASGADAGTPATGGASGDAGAADGGAPTDNQGPIVMMPSRCAGTGTRKLSSLMLESFEGGQLSVSWQVPTAPPPALLSFSSGAAATAYSGLVTSAASFGVLSTTSGSGRGAVLNVGVDQSSDARCLDVSQVSGISFWAHVGQASMPLEVVFIIPETQYAASTGKGFGDCLDRCNDHPRATVLLTAEWTQFFVPFQGTDQGNARVGKLLQAVGWEPTSAPGQPFFLDEIAFYK